MKIEHIAIWTKDLERLKGFYLKYFKASAGGKYLNPSKNSNRIFSALMKDAAWSSCKCPEYQTR